MTARTARNIHIGDQVLAALTDAAPHPLDTLQVAARVGLAGYPGQTEVWRALDRLAHRGLVERIRDPQLTCRLWRLREDAAGPIMGRASEVADA